jgi:riboflavin kinase/FMN adenylyltransferase
MKIIYDIFNYEEKINNAYVSIGNFDGVHRGHKALINSCIDEARKNNGVSVVFTFYNHTKETVGKGIVPKFINTLEEKIYSLELLGIDYLILQPFTKEFSELTGEEFIEKIILNKLNTREIFVGFDFHFGKNRCYDVKDLKDIGEKKHIKIREVSEIRIEDKVVSSTAIRNHILNGDLTTVNHLLDSPLILIGEVIHGRKIGRVMGFPTANLERVNKAYLPYGIYGGACKILGSDIEYDCVVNIGKNPTLKPNEKSVEVHILNFDKDIYGKKLVVQLIKHLRKEIKFSGIEELKKQIFLDIDNWKEYLETLKGSENGINS